MTIHIFDGIAVVRSRLETDTTGRVPRGLFTEMLSLRPGDIAIWCWDGPGAKAHRQSLYPPYKANRVPQPSAIWKTIEMMQEVFKHTPALQVTMPTYEADDLIAHIARTCHQEQAVHIHSIDKDLSALFTYSDVTGTFTPPKGVEPEWVPLYKLCVGDPSDNIKGITGFGEKTWADLRDAGLLEPLRLQLNSQTTTVDVLGRLPKKCQNWLAERDNWITLDQMRRVIEFRPVTEPLTYIKGVRNDAAGDAILKEFFL